MTKPVLCRIIESRLLETAEDLPQGYCGQPYPDRIRTVAFRRQKSVQMPPRRYPIDKTAGAAAPRGVWIDLFA